MAPVRRRLVVVVVVVSAALAACGGGGSAGTDDQTVQRVRSALDEQGLGPPFLLEAGAATDDYDYEGVSDADIRATIDLACHSSSDVGRLTLSLQLRGMLNGYIEDIVAVDRIVIEAACPDLRAAFEQAVLRIGDDDRIRHVPTAASERARLTEDAVTADGRIHLRIPVWPPPGAPDIDLPELSPEEHEAAFRQDVIAPLRLHARPGPVLVASLYAAIEVDAAFVPGATLPDSFGGRYSDAVATDTTVDGLPARAFEHREVISPLEAYVERVVLVPAADGTAVIRILGLGEERVLDVLPDAVLSTVDIVTGTES